MAFQIAREAKLHVVANKPRYSKDKKTIVIKPSYGNFGHDDIITVAMELKPVDISPSLVVQVTDPLTRRAAVRLQRLLNLDSSGDLASLVALSTGR